MSCVLAVPCRQDHMAKGRCSHPQTLPKAGSARVAPAASHRTHPGALTVHRLHTVTCLDGLPPCGRSGCAIVLSFAAALLCLTCASGMISTSKDATAVGTGSPGPLNARTFLVARPLAHERGDEVGSDVGQGRSSAAWRSADAPATPPCWPGTGPACPSPRAGAASSRWCHSLRPLLQRRANICQQGQQTK